MKKLFFAFALLAAPCFAAEPVSLFYLTNGPDSIRDFLVHSKQIDLLVPTWYEVDENGLVDHERVTIHFPASAAVNDAPAI